MALGSTKISDAMAYVWTESQKFIPGVQLGGIYAVKPGYHNTRNWNLVNNPGDYSIELPPDLLGSGELAAAIDLTMSTAEMKKRCAYLKNACLDPADYRTKYIREFIGTLDGSNVYCLIHNSEDGAFSFSGGRDSSHLWHIHISFFRKYAADMTAAGAIVSVLKGETLAQYEGGVIMALADDYDFWNLIWRAEQLVKGADPVAIPAHTPTNHLARNEPNDIKKSFVQLVGLVNSLASAVAALSVKVDGIATGTGLTEQQLRTIVFEEVNRAEDA